MNFRQSSNRCKRDLEAAKLAYANKTYAKKSLSFLRSLAPQTFGGIANSVLSKGKSTMPSLFNDPEVLSSAFDKANLFPENFSFL